MMLKNKKVNIGKYEVRSYTTPTRKLITGHFVFDLTRSKLQKKISRKLAKLIPSLKSRQKKECLTQQHYTRIAKDIK